MLLPTIPAPITTTLAWVGAWLTLPPSFAAPEIECKAWRAKTRLAAAPRNPLYRGCAGRSGVVADLVWGVLPGGLRRAAAGADPGRGRGDRTPGRRPAAGPGPGRGLRPGPARDRAGPARLCRDRARPLRVFTGRGGGAGQGRGLRGGLGPRRHAPASAGALRPGPEPLHRPRLLRGRPAEPGGAGRHPRRARARRPAGAGGPQRRLEGARV